MKEIEIVVIGSDQFILNIVVQVCSGQRSQYWEANEIEAQAKQ